jgi:asparagine synthase (glutamine-hydrolysing)
MCGICGEIRFDDGQASAAAVAAMGEALKPRGPDAAGLYSQDRIALGHRRLSILDLSAA